MAASLIRGVVSLSIDTESTQTEPSVSSDALDSVLIELLDRVVKHRLHATWALDDLSRRRAVERIARAVHQELAITGQRCVAPSDPRPLSAVRRLIHGRQAGLDISTVTHDPSWGAWDIDLLAKHGVSVIRAASGSAGSARPIASDNSRTVQTLRYGLWYVPISGTLSGSGWMPFFTQLSRLKRAVDQTVRERGWVHLRIDAVSLARADVAGGLRAVERLLRYLDQLRSSGRIEVETLCESAIRRQPKRTTAAATSILRAA